MYSPLFNCTKKRLFHRHYRPFLRKIKAESSKSDTKSQKSGYRKFYMAIGGYLRCIFYRLEAKRDTNPVLTEIKSTLFFTERTRDAIDFAVVVTASIKSDYPPVGLYFIFLQALFSLTQKQNLIYLQLLTQHYAHQA